MCTRIMYIEYIDALGPSFVARKPAYRIRCLYIVESVLLVVPHIMVLLLWLFLVYGARKQAQTRASALDYRLPSVYD